MIKLKKINKEIVNPIPVKKIDPKKIRGYSTIPALCCNIFACARKWSGKTNTVFKILDDCADKDTEIHIFSSTSNNDDNMIFIRKYFEKKKYKCNFYTEIKEGKENYLTDILKDLEAKTHDESDSDNEEIKYISVDNVKKKKKKKKKSKIAPERIFVFDDISSNLKLPQISKLVKQNRHYKCKVIISSQEVIDLLPESRKQIDIWLLFGKHPEERLEMIYTSASLPITFHLFKTLYDDATKEKYNFLLIDVNNNEYRKNFNQQYQLNLNPQV
jgi:hypothetical protein